MLKIIGYVVGGIVLLVIVQVIFLYYRAQTVGTPENVNNGDLSSCPDSPNCVSTQATDDQHRIEPIAYTSTIDEAKSKLIGVLEEMPKTEIITNEDSYVYAVARSATMNFPDDVEFVFDDEAKVIHFRSAARLGYGDMGVNRNRMESIREAFNAS